MPECNFFLRNNYCSNGEECLYLHIDPESKLPPCPHYDRGFCPLGPNCSKKHVRKEICPFFLAGFCWEGRTCKNGAHPRWGGDLPPPTVRKPKEEKEEERREVVEVRERERERERNDREGGGTGGGQRGHDGGRRFHGGRRPWVDRGGRGRKY
jgi:cleavage and polyadenylation specificity factor subunit 4